MGEREGDNEGKYYGFYPAKVTLTQRYGLFLVSFTKLFQDI